MCPCHVGDGSRITGGTMGLEPTTPMLAKRAFNDHMSGTYARCRGQAADGQGGRECPKRPDIRTPSRIAMTTTLRKPSLGARPRSLLRFPGLLAAATIGALLLTLVAAAHPMFLSRSEGCLLRAEISDPIITDDEVHAE
jgi:hypothetical protein